MSSIDDLRGENRVSCDLTSIRCVPNSTEVSIALLTLM
jgi:hypothetical protein